MTEATKQKTSPAKQQKQINLFSENAGAWQRLLTEKNQNRKLLNNGGNLAPPLLFQAEKLVSG